MKKILLSLGVIVVVGVAVAGATGAFYNDTEVSAGNIFTAGSIDLKVDQRLASYNGEECPTCHLKVVSDETNLLTTEGNAVVLSFIHPAWTADLDGGHVAGLNDGSNDGSKWIWGAQGPANPDIDESITFNKTFVWNGTVSTANLYIATDNNYVSVYLNGHLITSTTEENNFTTATEDVYSIPANYFLNGNNMLSITVRNAAYGNDPQENPAGLLYKLLVDGDCSSNNYGLTPGGQCQLWAEKDLSGEQFFNFGDVKPGDNGRNLISLHVDNNDAWMCLLSKNVVNDENVVVDPENPDPGLPDVGELGQHIDLFAWKDTNNNGVYDGSEVPLRHNFFDTFFNLPINDSSVGGPFLPNETQYLGLAWCAGTWNVSGYTMTCDGSTMPNNVQTDKLTADLEAYTEQWRNNPNFTCASVSLP